VRFEDLMVVTVKITAFWDVPPYSLVDICECFGTTCCLCFHGMDESSKFLQNVGKQLPEYMALYFKRQ
jgi:hypothetical protein